MEPKEVEEAYNGLDEHAKKIVDQYHAFSLRASDEELSTVLETVYGLQKAFNERLPHRWTDKALLLIVDALTHEQETRRHT